MGGCLVQQPSRHKYQSEKVIRIKEEFNIAIPPTTTSLPLQKQSSNMPSQPTISLQGLNIESKKQVDLPEIDPIEDMKKYSSERKPNIRPTESIFVPEQTSELKKQQNKPNNLTPKHAPVRQSQVKALFPDGLPAIQQESSHPPSRPDVRSSGVLPTKASQVRKSRLSLEKVDYTRNFLESNVNMIESSKEIPHDLPSKSIVKKPTLEVQNNLGPPKEAGASVMKSNMMLESQTVPLLEQIKLEKERASQGNKEAEAATIRHTVGFQESVPKEEVNPPEGVKWNTMIFKI